MFVNIRLWVCVPIVFVFFSFNVIAADVAYSAAAILTVYDNIKRVPDPVTNEFGKSVRGGLSIVEDSANITGSFVSSVEAVEYQKNLARDEIIARIFTDMTWRISPRIFEWYLSDTFTQASIDSLVGDTPANRQNTNAFLTGPNYFFRLSGRSSLNFTARAKDYRYEANNTDNERSAVSGEWLYDINSSISFSLNYYRENINFNDDISNDDFVRNDVFLRFDYDKRNRSLLMEYGETDTTNSQGVYNRSSRYLLDYKTARRSDANSRLIVSRSVSDVSSDILNPADDQLFNTIAVNSDIFVDQTVRILHTELYKTGAFTFSSYRSTSEYNILTSLDEVEKGAKLQGYWDYTRRSRLRLQASRVNNVYVNQVPLREDDDHFYRVENVYSLRRNVKLKFEVNSIRRLSTIATQNYNDNRAIVSIEYASI